MIGKRNSTRVNAEVMPPSEHPAFNDNATHWLRQNIFNGVINSVLSLIIIALGVVVVSIFIEWAVLNSVWNAESVAECHEIIVATHGTEARGACWAVLKDRADLLLFGFYPPAQYWRPMTALVLLLIALAPTVFRSMPRLMLCFTALYPVIAYYLIWGGFGLQAIQSRMFGGLFLTLVIATASIAIAIPTGVALALGRKFLILPLRAICAAIITFVAGVPLLILLFSSFILFHLALPPGTSFDIISRAIMIIALHTGTRIAEMIREGFLTLPHGQWEAAKALGFGHTKALWLVILPQVLRRISPRIVRASVGAFRDTTLISISTLLDPVALLLAIRNDVNWQGIIWELFIFVGLLYWVFCF